MLHEALHRVYSPRLASPDSRDRSGGNAVRGAELLLAESGYRRVGLVTPALERRDEDGVLFGSARFFVCTFAPPRVDVFAQRPRRKAAWLAMLVRAPEVLA